MSTTYTVSHYRGGRAEVRRFTVKAVADAYYDCMVEEFPTDSTLMTSTTVYEESPERFKRVDYWGYEVRRDRFDGDVDFESFEDFNLALDHAEDLSRACETSCVTIEGHYLCCGHNDSEVLWDYSSPSYCSGPGCNDCFDCEAR